MIPVTPALEAAMALLGLLGAAGWILALELWRDAGLGRKVRAAQKRYRMRKRGVRL